MAEEEAVPVVSKRVEEGLREKQLVRARALCRAEIEALVECTRTGLVSVAWRCRPHKEAVNACLAPHTAPALLDQLKRDYVADL